MITRINRKKLPEWLLLDGSLLLSSLLYVAVQYLITGQIVDQIFILLLNIATIFLNFRQKNLFNALSSGDGEKIFCELYSKEQYECQINNIFAGATDTYLAVIFAGIFSAVMSFFEIWMDMPTIKIFFIIFIFVANIPTGYAIIRIMKYFYYNILWINDISAKKNSFDNTEIYFIKKICTKVLFTAATYCAVSLSSILFTELKINFIIMCYTFFATSIVVLTLLLTHMALKKSETINRLQMIDEVNARIMNVMLKRVEDENHNEDEMKKIKELLEIKEYIMNQNKDKFDISRLISSVGLLFITVIPVIVQWVLDKFIP